MINKAVIRKYNVMNIFGNVHFEILNMGVNGEILKCATS